MSATVQDPAALSPSRHRARGLIAHRPRGAGGGSIIFGLSCVFVVVLLALIGPAFAPHSPSAIVGAPFSQGHGLLFGTDYLGRDVLSRVLDGGRTLIALSFAAAAIGTGVGALIGVTAAYYKGAASAAILVVFDALFVFPAIVIGLLFVSVWGPKPFVLVLAIALAHVPAVGRVAWSAALPVVDREHVMWSRAVGIRPWRILVVDVAPVIISPLTVEFGLRLMWSIGSIAALSFIGSGIQPPAADWGLMVNENRDGLSLNPWGTLAPMICVAVFSLGCYLASDGFARRVSRTEARA